MQHDVKPSVQQGIKCACHATTGAVQSGEAMKLADGIK